MQSTLGPVLGIGQFVNYLVHHRVLLLLGVDMFQPPF